MSATITLTDRAATRIREIVQREPGKAALRVAVNGGGCSGFQYEFQLTDVLADDDLVIERGGAKALVDPVSQGFLAGSEIDFNKWNWDTHRYLQLTGEAYFKVAKGKKFEVQTVLGKVTVLGTQFNVKARKNRFDVTCYEGRVKVNYKNQQVLITKGERVSFENGKLLSTPNSNSVKPEWTSGELAFVNEKLSAILEEMERQFNCTIENKDVSNEQLFTGTLPANNLEESLQIIAAIYHLQYKKGNNHTIILEHLNVEE